jgi:hypothetical protein
MLTINLSESLQKATSVAFLMPQTTGHIIKNKELSHTVGTCKPLKTTQVWTLCGRCCARLEVVLVVADEGDLAA